MTTEFARFAIRETLSLQEYQRWLRLAGEHSEWLDQKRLMEYWIDEKGAYLIDDNPIIDGDEAAQQVAETASPTQAGETASPTQVAEAGSPTLGAHELRATAWFIILFIAAEYLIFSVPIKNQLASWGFAFIVISLIWQWLAPWLESPAHRRLLGWLGLAVCGLWFLVSWVGVIP